MPRAKNQRQSKEWESAKAYRSANSYGMAAEFSGWVNCNLSAEHRRQYDEWYKTTDSLRDFNECLIRHYRLSVGEDLRDGGYVANAFMRFESSPHAGRMTSQRSGDAVTAMFKLVFAITHVMPLDWTELERDDDGGW